MNEVKANRKKPVTRNPLNLSAFEKKINTTITQLLIPNANDLISNSKQLIRLNQKANENINLVLEYKKELNYRHKRIDHRRSEVKKLNDSLSLKRLHKEEEQKLLTSHFDLLRSNNLLINTQLEDLQCREILLTIKEHYLDRLLLDTIATDEESQTLCGETRNNLTEFNVSQTGFIHNVDNSGYLNDQPLGATVTYKEDFLNISSTQGNIQAFIQTYNHDRQMFKNKSNKPLRKCKSAGKAAKRRMQLARVNVKGSKAALKEQPVPPVKVPQAKIIPSVIKREVPRIKKKVKKTEPPPLHAKKMNKEQLKAISDKVLNESGINQVIEEFNAFDQASDLFISKNYLSKPKESQKKTVSEEEKNNDHQVHEVNQYKLKDCLKGQASVVSSNKKPNQLEHAHQMLKSYLIESKNNRYNNSSISNAFFEPLKQGDKENEQFISIGQKKNCLKPLKFPITADKPPNIKSVLNTEEASHKRRLLFSEQTPKKKTISNRAQLQHIVNRLFHSWYCFKARSFWNNLNNCLTVKVDQTNYQKANERILALFKHYYFAKSFFPSLLNSLYCVVQEYSEAKKRVASSSPSLAESLIQQSSKPKITIIQVEDLPEDNEPCESSNTLTDLKQYEKSLIKIKEITKATQEIESQIKSFTNQMLNSHKA